MATSETYRPSKEVFEIVQRRAKPSFLPPLMLCVLDHILIWLPTVFVFGLTNSIGWLAIFLLPATLVLSARSMRGLECMVHDASHYNWSRRFRHANDFIANVLAAVPVMSTVRKYRETHTLHHNSFATDADPDYLRHEELNFDEFDRSSLASTLLGVSERFFPYTASWWKAIGTNKVTFVLFCLWHLVAFICAWVVLGNVATAASFWLVAYGVPFFVVLPILRMIGEAAEHDYEHGQSEESLTYSNVGIAQEFLFHPHNDGLHTLHHAFPHVPHYNLGRLHSDLMRRADSGWQEYVRVRSGLFIKA